jgi:hypothetical protein
MMAAGADRILDGAALYECSQPSAASRKKR